MTELTPRKRGRPPALTQKQKRFAELYVYSRGKKNLTQCAFEAGYKNRPSVNASELRNPRLYPLVCDYIKQLERFLISLSIVFNNKSRIFNITDNIIWYNAFN